MFVPDSCLARLPTLPEHLRGASEGLMQTGLAEFCSLEEACSSLEKGLETLKGEREASG